MTEKRFELGNGGKGPLIYDNEGPDDYYFVNDEKELQQFIDLVNETLTENTKYLIKQNNQLDKALSELAKTYIQSNAKNVMLNKVLERICKEHDLDLIEELRKDVIEEFTLF